jgi:hypothetical protein
VTEVAAAAEVGLVAAAEVELVVAAEVELVPKVVVGLALRCFNGTVVGESRPR